MSQKIGVSPAKGKLGERDAIHVPIVLARAMTQLRPSANVKFLDNTLTTVKLVPELGRHGIVDPFYPDAMIQVGTLVYIFLVPDAVINLSHHWELDVEDFDAGEFEYEEEEKDYSGDEGDGCAGCYS
jgi:hypothetical protein